MHITNPAEAKSQRFANCPKNRYVFKGNVCKPCLLIISDGNKKSFHVPITLITATVTIIVLIKGSTVCVKGMGNLMSNDSANTTVVG